jgi:hypothetical protein
MSNKILANFFYEQCAGASSGHMAMIPNNAVLFGLVRAYSRSSNNTHAASKAQFSEMLREIANDLDGETTEG